MNTYKAKTVEELTNEDKVVLLDLGFSKESYIQTTQDNYNDGEFKNLPLDIITKLKQEGIIYQENPDQEPREKVGRILENDGLHILVEDADDGENLHIKCELKGSIQGMANMLLNVADQNQGFYDVLECCTYLLHLVDRPENANE